MTKQEATTKIEELKIFLKNLDAKSEPVGYKNDTVFLLSVEEYERYKDVINKYCIDVESWWWLRSPGRNSNNAAYVYDGGSVNYYGYDVNFTYFVVRPAFKIPTNYAPIGTKITVHNYNPNTKYSMDLTLVKLDNDNNGNDIYFSVLPVAWHGFDNKDNIYETSEIRQFLLNNFGILEES